VTRITLLFLFLFETFILNTVSAEETIKVASIYAYSGVASASNRASVLGIRYGVDEVNKRGGVLGRKIELIELDNASTPIGSKIAADIAVKKQVTAIIGASWSSHSLAVAKVAQSSGIPMISTDSTHPEVTRIGDYIFRVCYTDPYQGSLMAHFALSELGATTASMLVDASSDYSTGLASVFSHHFKEQGGRIEKIVYYKHKQEHFRKEVEELKEVESEALFIPGHDESAAILFEIERTGMQSIPLGCDGWSTAETFEKGMLKVRRGYFSTHWSEGVKTPRSRNFVALFKKQGKPLSSEPLGYDAVMLLADALERAQSLGAEQVKKALRQTRDFQGVTGEISFDRHGDPIKSIVIVQVKNGETRFLKSITPEQLVQPATGSLEGVR